MNTDSNGKGREYEGNGERAAFGEPLNGKASAAFWAVTAAAALTPFLGAAAFLALSSAFAAATAACKTKLKYFFFVPGAAMALVIYYMQGSVLLGGLALAFSLLCGAALGVVLRRRQSASVQTLTGGAVAYFFVFAVFVSFAMYAFGSVSAATEAVRSYLSTYMDEVFRILENAVVRYSEGDPQGAAALNLAAIPEIDRDAFVRSLILSFPGVAAGCALFFGWLAQLLARPFLILFGRRDMVTDKRRIVLPLSLVIVYLAVTLIASFSAEDTVLTVAAANVADALVPALFCVGVGYIADFVRAGRGRFPVMFAVMFILGALLMPSLCISLVRAVGVAVSLVRGIRAHMPSDRE